MTSPLKELIFSVLFGENKMVIKQINAAGNRKVTEVKDDIAVHKKDH